jgi:hypothetical protein
LILSLSLIKWLHTHEDDCDCVVICACTVLWLYITCKKEETWTQVWGDPPKNIKRSQKERRCVVFKNSQDEGSNFLFSGNWLESVFKQIIFAQYVFEQYIFVHLKMFLLKEIAFLYMNYKIQNLFIRPAVDQPVTGISVPCTLLYVHILIILL